MRKTPSRMCLRGLCLLLRQTCNHGSKINKKTKGNETMSRADEYRYQIERQRKQELARQRVRETTRPFVERYRSILNDVASPGLDDVISTQSFGAWRLCWSLTRLPPET